MLYIFPPIMLLYLFIAMKIQDSESGSLRSRGRAESTPSSQESKPTDTDSKEVKQTAFRFANQFMSTEEKAEYIQTEQWGELKLKRLIIANYICEVPECTAKHNLHLHHINYIRLGAEHIEDLRIVCDKHHNAIHVITGKDRLALHPISVLREAQEKLNDNSK